MHACSTDGCKISFDFGNKISKLILSQIIAYLRALPTHHNRGGLAMTAEPRAGPSGGHGSLGRTSYSQV